MSDTTTPPAEPKAVSPLVKVATALEVVQSNALIAEFSGPDHPEEGEVLTKLAAVKENSSNKETLARKLGAGVFVYGEMEKAAAAKAAETE